MPRDSRDRESVPQHYLESVGRSGRSEDSSSRRRNDRDRYSRDDERMTKRGRYWGSSSGSYKEDRRRQSRSRSRSRSPSRSRSRSPSSRAKRSAGSTTDVNNKFSTSSGIQMKLLAPAATSLPAVKNKTSLPISSASSATSNRLGTNKLKVASIFNDDDDDEPEEMPAECRMRMKNVGRETPTSAGPNSFGKTKIGFCNVTHITEKKHNV